MSELGPLPVLGLQKQIKRKGGYALVPKFLLTSAMQSEYHSANSVNYKRSLYVSIEISSELGMVNVKDIFNVYFYRLNAMKRSLA